MASSYHTYQVEYSHTTEGRETREVNQATLVVYGESEFAVLAELKRQRPEHTDPVILNCEMR